MKLLIALAVCFVASEAARQYCYDGDHFGYCPDLNTTTGGQWFFPTRKIARFGCDDGKYLDNPKTLGCVRDVQGEDGCSWNDTMTEMCKDFSGYEGCYRDYYGLMTRAAERTWSDSIHMTVPRCISFCSKYGLDLAMLRDNNECFCHKEGIKYKQFGNSTSCTNRCSGDKSQVCGGDRVLSVYSIKATALSGNIPLVHCPKVDPGTGTLVHSKKVNNITLIGDSARLQCNYGSVVKNGAKSAQCVPDAKGNAMWSQSLGKCEPIPGYLGCFRDGYYSNNLVNIFSSKNRWRDYEMTTTKCLAFCKESGFELAGLKVGRYCYCGMKSLNLTVNGAPLKGARYCRTTCYGDRDQYCGGDYNVVSVYDVTMSSFTGLTKITCPKLNIPNGRIVYGSSSVNNLTFPEGAVSVTCNDGTVRLGYSRLTCVQKDDQTDPTWNRPAPVCEVIPGYLGCFRERYPEMKFDPSTVWTTDFMTATKCIKHCKGLEYNYAALEYGNICHCGNNELLYDAGAASVCNDKCKGNSTQICGDYKKLSIYQLNVKVTTIAPTTPEPTTEKPTPEPMKPTTAKATPTPKAPTPSLISSTEEPGSGEGSGEIVDPGMGSLIG
ncbi:WSC domain-containing protein ARB_07867 [Lingula anatina]|uniref:WSC domain-containing protein ARB_07867 n=1 Tax=Lingula anatina TaxID=7574 RepID=A0A1S3JQS1_LINAN|nr:WSC domain-containing protein ARB_07867 [Lingula anatina]|eukprot:XP_013412471.1 WSC domain-containing protein ARB_07867 [Lingula anatina]